nr:unnamed protein product [Callosobruchus analis]
MIEHDYRMFSNFCRMSPEDFKILLELVEPYIMKSDTNYSRAIPAAERLAVTRVESVFPRPHQTRMNRSFV